MRTILIATANEGKFREIVAELAQADVDEASLPATWVSLSELGRRISEPVEDRETFFGNAVLKAKHYACQSGLWTLAEDSGLEVDALGGRPGVHSARFAGSPEGTPKETASKANNARLIMELGRLGGGPWVARYRCAMVLSDNEQVLASAEGVLEGMIVEHPRGAGGFGYDPYFLVPALGRTTAEISMVEKNRISHRGSALRLMRTKIRELLEVTFQFG